jgi:hypothetical protein
MRRAGTFFILLGILLVGLYVLSDVAKSPTFWLLATGGLGIGVGIGMRLSASKTEAQADSGRFRLIKQIKNPPPKKLKGEKKPFRLSFGTKKQTEKPDKSPADRGKSEKPGGKSPKK